jgi:hypothetical protein
MFAAIRRASSLVSIFAVSAGGMWSFGSVCVSDQSAGKGHGGSVDGPEHFRANSSAGRVRACRIELRAALDIPICGRFGFPFSTATQ